MKKGVTLCHPDRKHHAKGKCEPCYFARYHQQVRKPRRTQYAVVRVGVSGWGCIA